MTHFGSKCLFPGLEYIPLLSLDECHPEESHPIIDGILYKNTFTLLHGFKETYKSWFAGYLAVCLSSGADFFGHNVVTSGKVLYVYGEGKMIRRLQYLCNGLGISFPRNLIPYKLSADLTQGDALKDLKSHMPNDIALIIIDNYEKFWWSNMDEKTVSNALQFMREVRELANVLLVQHQAKSAASRSSGHENAIGIVRMVNDADATIELKMDKRTRRVLTVVYHRDEDVGEEFRFILEKRAVDALILTRSEQLSGQLENKDDSKRLIDEAVQILSQCSGENLYTKTYICNELLRPLKTKGERKYSDIWEGIVKLRIIKEVGNKYRILPLPDTSQK